jgi:hypothetical protein
MMRPKKPVFYILTALSAQFFAAMIGFAVSTLALASFLGRAAFMLHPSQCGLGLDSH